MHGPCTPVGLPACKRTYVSTRCGCARKSMDGTRQGAGQGSKADLTMQSLRPRIAQVHRQFRKPLIVMSPKALLRHPKCKSPLTEFDDHPDDHGACASQRGAACRGCCALCVSKNLRELDAARAWPCPVALPMNSRLQSVHASKSPCRCAGCGCAQASWACASSASSWTTRASRLSHEAHARLWRSHTSGCIAQNCSQAHGIPLHNRVDAHMGSNKRVCAHKRCSASEC